jgi:hypothetical protein
VLDRGCANFSELRVCELRRILFPRTPVNKGKIKAGRPVPGPSSRLYSLLGTVMRTASPARPRLIRARTVRVSQRRRCHSGQRQKASKQSRCNSPLHHFTSFPFLQKENRPTFVHRQVAGCATGSARFVSAHLNQGGLQSLYTSEYSVPLSYVVNLARRYSSLKSLVPKIAKMDAQVLSYCLPKC